MYTITLVHSSISKSRVVHSDKNLEDTKRLALEEFGEEQRDYEILICDDRGPVASCLVGNRQWL